MGGCNNPTPFRRRGLKRSIINPSYLPIYQRTYLPTNLSTNKTQINERLCIYCNNSVIETEEHMLLLCPCYSSLREQFFSKVTGGEIEINTLNTKQLTITFLSSSNPAITIYLSKFILKCFELRATIAQNQTN